MTTSRHLRLHHDSFSSTRQFSSSSLGTPSSSKSPDLHSHSLGGCGGGGLQWRAQADLNYYAAVAVKEQKG
jgi:hypothetical protein